MPTAKLSAARAVAPAVDPTVGLATINVFDGTRNPIANGTQILLTITDGAQNLLYREYFSGPSITLSLPFHNNFSDNYSIVVSASGYQQSGFQPVHIAPNAPQTLDLMLLPKNAGFNFAHAKWADVQAQLPLLAKIFSASASDAAASYANLEEQGDHLACLLNITTALQQIQLPRLTPLDYFKEFDLPNLAPDRIFGYADAQLVAQVKQAAQQREFATEPAIDLALHPGATSSFKQIQFGEANVQLTFHENNRKTINGIDCVYVEPDIDYYKDPGAHLLLEVLPNALTGMVSNPRVVYVLRWIAGQHAGVANFDPLYTIQ
jgi:hypothetical protein